MSNNSKTLFQIGMDSARTIIHPRKHTERVAENMKAAQGAFASARAALDRALVVAGDAAPADLESLCESMRFSDPMGTAETAEAEQELLKLASDIEHAAISGSIPLELIRQAIRQLSLRNLMCQKK